MPFCPICSSALTKAASSCPNCGAEFNAQSGLSPVPVLGQQAEAPSSYSGVRQVELPPLLSPALSLAISLLATLVAAVGLALAGFFWGGALVAIVLPTVVLVPVFALQRKNLGLTLGLAAIAVVVGFNSCAANFRWAGG